MLKRTKIWIITAVLLMTVGLIIFAFVMSLYHWDFTKLNTDEYETITYDIYENFDDIKIKSFTGNIVFAVSDDNCRVVCYRPSAIKQTVGVFDSVLTVNETVDKKWYEHIGINLSSPTITVYLPKMKYEALYIENSTGNIEIPKDFLFSDADISVTTGDVRFSASVDRNVNIKTTTGDMDITDVKCENLISSGSTGSIVLKNVVALKKISIERNTGDVRIDASDAAEIFIKTSTGDVTGNLLSDKIFITDTSTGSVKVPKTTSGGKCEIITSTGDVVFIK